MLAAIDIIPLLNTSCGSEFIVVFLVVESLLMIGAVTIFAIMRHQHALAMFMPLTLTPLFLGGLRSLLTLSMAVELMSSTESTSADQTDGFLFLAMSAVPFLFGVVLMAPAFFIVVLGRLWLTIQANRKPKATNSREDETIDTSVRSIDHMTADADRYMAELTKFRR